MKDYFDYIYGVAFLFFGVCFGYGAYVNLGKGDLEGMFVVFAVPFSVIACIMGVYYFGRRPKGKK